MDTSIVRIQRTVSIIPRKHACGFQGISSDEMEDMGFMLMSFLKKFSAVFQREVPFSYFIHTAPNRVTIKNHWHSLDDDYHWYFEIIPRLVRGAELNWVQDCILTTSPEKAAKFLREVG